MARRRHDENGDYLLPSERGGDDDDGLIYEPDAIEVAAALRAHSGNIDDLSHKAQLKEQAWKERNRRAPHVRINPPSAYRGTLGNQATVQSGGAAQVAIWTADDDEEATVLTATFAPVQLLSPTGDLAAPQYRPYGIVQFGNRGFSVAVEVDIGTGQQITFSGTSAIVRVAMDPAAVVAQVGQMQLAGMLSFFATKRTTPAIRTRYVDALGNGASQKVTIPPFASELLPVQMSTPGGSVQLDFEDATGHILYTVTVPAPGAQVAPIPISGDAVAVLVTNTSAGAENVRLMFGINV